jgi:hypothetical protein
LTVTWQYPTDATDSSADRPARRATSADAGSSKVRRNHGSAAKGDGADAVEARDNEDDGGMPMKSPVQSDGSRRPTENTAGSDTTSDHAAAAAAATADSADVTFTATVQKKTPPASSAGPE